MSAAAHGARVPPTPRATPHRTMAKATPALIYFAGTLEIFLPQKSRGLGQPPGAVQRDLGCVLAKIAIGDSDLINVRFVPLCVLKSDISRGPRSADCVAKVAKRTL